jgi:hypothetical protein
MRCIVSEGGANKRLGQKEWAVIYLGYDPGGNDRHGTAALSVGAGGSPKVETALLHSAEAAITWMLRQELYWSLGRDLSDRRREWGTGVIDQVSADLRAAFPEMKGFSPPT